MTVSFSPNTTESAVRSLAVFDLDGTLVRGDSFLPFVIGYARSRKKIKPLLTLPFWLGLYGAGLLADHRAKQKVLVSFFRHEPLAAVSEYANRFCSEWIRPRLQKQVAERLEWHLSSGHRVILLSASPNLYVDAVGRDLGIPEVICTRVKALARVWEGSIEGANCKGEEKLHRLQNHIGCKNWLGDTYSYGDSKSDLPVLRWARNGFFVRSGGLLSPVR